MVVEGGRGGRAECFGFRAMRRVHSGRLVRGAWFRVRFAVFYKSLFSEGVFFDERVEVLSSTYLPPERSDRPSCVDRGPHDISTLSTRVRSFQVYLRM